MWGGGVTWAADNFLNNRSIFSYNSELGVTSWIHSLCLGVYVRSTVRALPRDFTRHYEIPNSNSA